MITSSQVGLITQHVLTFILSITHLQLVQALQCFLWSGVSSGPHSFNDGVRCECLALQTGLMVACYHGYVEVVIALSLCPHLDVNWQDTEGNTALITAAQAGGSYRSFSSYTRSVEISDGNSGNLPIQIILAHECLTDSFFFPNKKRLAII